MGGVNCYKYGEPRPVDLSLNKIAELSVNPVKLKEFKPTIDSIIGNFSSNPLVTGRAVYGRMGLDGETYYSLQDIPAHLGDIYIKSAEAHYYKSGELKPVNLYLERLKRREYLDNLYEGTQGVINFIDRRDVKLFICNWCLSKNLKLDGVEFEYRRTQNGVISFSICQSCHAEDMSLFSRESEIKQNKTLLNKLTKTIREVCKNG